MLSKKIFLVLFLTLVGGSVLIWTLGSKPGIQGPSTPPKPEPLERVYPQGKLFPLGLYSIREEMLSVNTLGWNLAQTYDFKPEYLTICAKAGIFALAYLEEKKEADAKTATRKLL